MSPADRIFYLRAQQRVARMEPDIARAVLRAFEIIRENLSEAELSRIVDSGNLDRLFAEALSDAVMDQAFIPTRVRMREAIRQGFKYTTSDLPKGGAINGSIAVSFDVLNPSVIQGIRTLDTKVIQGLSTDIRESVRAFVEQGLRDGVGPRAIGRNIRSIIGMSPTQTKNAIAREAEWRADPTLKAARVERMVETYRKRAVSLNAETNARTATLDAMKLGQRLAWEDAIDMGIVDRGDLVKTWRGVLDDRERDEHVAMEGEVQPFDLPFSNGEMICGDSTYNCRCIPLYRVSRRAA